MTATEPSGSGAEDRLPDGVSFVRRTDELTAATTPAGLARAHRLAPGVWGELEVRAGQVTFVWEDSGRRHVLEPGATLVIRPEVAHHVEPDDDARFSVAFHR